ncbi:MAG: MFS transporter [Lachnospiraceae bacterium]
MKIVLFLISQCITLFGSTLVQMAIIWYVTLYTGSGIWVAVFSVCSYLPQFLISFPGGVWADRYNRKWLIIGADTGIALVTGGMVWAFPHIGEGRLLLGCLLVMALFRSIGAGIQIPAVNAVLPQMVPRDQLMHFNGINAAMQSLVQFAAPAVAGVILTVSELKTTLWIDILTAALGIGIFASIRLTKEEKENPPEPSTIVKDVWSGIRYACMKKTVGILLAVYGIFTCLCVPAGFLSGLFVSRVYGDTYWYLTAAELAGFAGMVAGGLLMSVWSGFPDRAKTLQFGLVIFGLMAIAMGSVREFTLYLMFMGIYGVALTVVQTTITTTLQETAEPFMRGRIFGLFSSVYAGCYPLGMMVFGLMADAVPLQWIMVISGILLVGVAMIVKKTLQPTHSVLHC